MSTLFWIAIAIVGSLLFKFLSELRSDNKELSNQILPEKFKTLIQVLNSEIFQEQADVTLLNKRAFNLYKRGSNQILQFHYSTGVLTITWRYKYFQQEVVHEKNFYDCREANESTQRHMANVIIQEMSIIIHKHQQNILNQNL